MAKKKSKLYLAVIDAAKDVTPEAVREFGHDHVDMLITEAFLTGQVTVPAVAKFCETSKGVIRHRLLDPVRCAWISERIERLISNRLGNVMASVYARAVGTGDPNAAKFLMQHYGRLRPEERRSVNVDISVDYTGFTDEELKKIAEEKARKLGFMKEVHNVRDAEFSVRSSAGADQPAAGRSGCASGVGASQGAEPGSAGGTTRAPAEDSNAAHERENE
jgi:hypothetical protein